jgi:hypothetical protein
MATTNFTNGIAVGVPLTMTGKGAQTQATNRTTTVVLNTQCGTITTHNASLAAEAAAEFTVTCAAVLSVADVVAVSIQSGSNGGNTAVAVTTVAVGSFKIKVSNNNAAAGTAETGAILINYAVINVTA